MEWLKQERQKLKTMTPAKQLEYIWQYYKLWLCGFAALAAVLVYTGTSIASAVKDNYLYLVFVGTYADIGEGSAFYKDFLSFSGTDPQTQSVIFDTGNYFNMAEEDVTGNHYFEKVTVLIDSRTADALVMEPDNLTAFGANGRLMDLSDPRARLLTDQYADRLITTSFTDEQGQIQNIPVGFDISDSILMTKFNLYADGCALGISSDAQHIDAVGQFLNYLLQGR